MRFTTRWMEVTYEAFFAGPVFELPAGQVALLRAFYEAVSPRFAVGLNDLQVAGGASIGDVRARMVLFGGNAVFEISPEKFTAIFSALRTESDITVAKDCISLVNQALVSTFSAASYREWVLSPTAYLELQGSDTAAIEFLDRYAGRKDPQLRAAKGGKVHYGLLADIENPGEKSRTNVRIERLFSQQRILLISLRSIFQRDSTFQAFEDQAAYVESVANSVLKDIGLEFSPNA